MTGMPCLLPYEPFCVSYHTVDTNYIVGGCERVEICRKYVMNMVVPLP